MKELQPQALQDIDLGFQHQVLWDLEFQVLQDIQALEDIQVLQGFDCQDSSQNYNQVLQVLQALSLQE